MNQRHGFTLIEASGCDFHNRDIDRLVATGRDRVRAAASRIQCANNLKQIALAAHNYNNAQGTFPGGLYLYTGSFSVGPPIQGYTLFVSILPYLEQQPLYNTWNFASPLLNGEQTATTPKPPAARVLNVLVCPSDWIAQNPCTATKHPPGTFLFGVTSYGGNGGTQSYPNPTFDGMFYAVGPASSPLLSPVRVLDVSDGLSNTLLFGERFHTDHNFDALVSPVPSSLSMDLIAGYGWWGSACGSSLSSIGSIVAPDANG